MSDSSKRPREDAEPNAKKPRTVVRRAVIENACGENYMYLFEGEPEPMARFYELIRECTEEDGAKCTLLMILHINDDEYTFRRDGLMRTHEAQASDAKDLAWYRRFRSCFVENGLTMKEHDFSETLNLAVDAVTCLCQEWK